MKLGKTPKTYGPYGLPLDNGGNLWVREHDTWQHVATPAPIIDVSVFEDSGHHNIPKLSVCILTQDGRAFLWQIDGRTYKREWNEVRLPL